MGWDATAYTVVGVRMSAEKLLAGMVAKERCCDHPEMDTKFCPECGRYMWVAVAPEEVDDVAGLPVVFDDCSREGFAFVGVCSDGVDARGTSTVNMVPMPLESLVGAKDKVKAALEPIGLWDESQFGVWTAMYQSY